MPKKKVLFVCTGNSCRSVMASYYLKKLLGDMPQIQIDSAGTAAIEGLRASDNAIDVLKKEGINAASHLTKSITGDMIESSDLIFVMSDLHKERILEIAPQAWGKVYLLGSFADAVEENTNIPDPIGKPLEVYEVVFETIKGCAEKIAQMIREGKDLEDEDRYRL